MLNFTIQLFFLFFIPNSHQTSYKSIDALHYYIHIDNINFTDKTIHAHTRVIFSYTDTSSNTLALSLINFNIDSCILDDKKITYTYRNDSILFSLPSERSLDNKYEIEIWYNGTPAHDKYWGGFFIEEDMAYNYGVGMAAEPPSFGRAWFPCNDSFIDRAYYTITIDAPKDYVAVANGLLKKQTNLNNGTRYLFYLSESIPTYLVSVAVSKFDILKDNYQGLMRQIPISIYIPKGDKEKANNTFKNLKEGMHAYESLFGPYVWDRIGYVATPFNGGAMEHATNIAYSRKCHTQGCESTIFHELSHHWFGDLVTCTSEKDMWLNEGWASYSEYLYFEKIYGFERAQQHLAKLTHTALKYGLLSDGAYIALNNPNHSQTYGTNIYKKGAMAVHNLRFEMGDSLFFATVKAYLKTNAFKNKSIKDLQIFFEQYSGLKLNNYFKNWIETPGYADYSIDFYSVSKQANEFKVKLSVRQQLLARDYWAIGQHLEVLFISKSGNTEIHQLVANGELTDSIFTLSQEPISVILDPYNKLCDAQFTYSPLLHENKLWSNDDIYLKLKPQKLSKNTIKSYITYHYVPPYNKTNEGTFEEEYWSVNIENSQNQTITAWFVLPPQLKLRRLFFRPNINESWQELTNESSNYTEFKISDLKTGEYAFGKPE